MLDDEEVWEDWVGGEYLYDGSDVERRVQGTGGSSEMLIANVYAYRYGEFGGKSEV